MLKCLEGEMADLHFLKPLACVITHINMVTTATHADESGQRNESDHLQCNRVDSKIRIEKQQCELSFYSFFVACLAWSDKDCIF